MTIDKTSNWWTGTEAGDLEGYLAQFASDFDLAVDAFRISRCPDCGSLLFQVEYLDGRTSVRHVCMGCGRAQYVCDSGGPRWHGACRSFICPACSSQVANVGVGFTLNPAKDSVEWLYVGLRCARCGLLGCPADWSVGYSPSMHILDWA